MMKVAMYSGSLQTKKKAELREIALALHISDAGTREEIHLRIRKHLDENQTWLEDNPTFSGLYFSKRTRKHINHVSSPSSGSPEVILEKRMGTPPSTRSTNRNTVSEITPAPEAREVSMMLKNAPISPLGEETPSAPPAVTPVKDRSILFTSTPRSILRNIQRPSLDLADTTLKTIQTGAEQQARECLLASRSTLSNSLNISLITALFELIYVLYRVIPWKIFVVRIVSAGEWKLTVPYPPLVTFQTYAFWSVLLHWTIPTLIIPAVVGSVISFHPANAATLRIPRVLSFDSLTASIARLAAHYGYPYKALDGTIRGIDVIGAEWRILTASVVVAFAFAEAIFTAPSAFTESRARQRAGTPRRTVTLED